MTESPESTDKDLDALADKLYKRINQKEKEEKNQNDQKKLDPDAEHAKGYALCSGCSRILTRNQYENSSCPYCGATKAIIINSLDWPKT